MNLSLLGLLCALVNTNQSPAVSNLVAASSNLIQQAENPVEAEFHELTRRDDEAMDTIDEWIRQNNKFTEQGAGVPPSELNARIRNHIAPIRAAYEDFIKSHPQHVGARVAYASLLEDFGEGEAAVNQLETARELAPNDPAIWNNLANHYGHDGEVKKAFDYYTKAIELDPNESVYYHNFGTTVFLFRKDAREHYGITENEVFEKSLTLYSNAMRCDPTNFPLAADVASSYYGMRPIPYERALESWTNALSVASHEVEREGVYLHFARLKLNSGRFDQARAHLDAVTNSGYDDLKRTLVRNLHEKMAQAATNSPAAGEDQASTNAAVASPAKSD